MLAKEGARVLLCDTNEAGANETIKMAGGAPIEFVKLELTDGASIDACAKEALKRASDKIDVFVNAAGWDRTQPFVEADQAFLDKVLGINLVGPVRLTRALFPALMAGGGGKIVFVASDAGRVGSLGETPYSAAKGGIIGFTKSLAREGAAAQDHRQLRLPRPHRHAPLPRQPRAHARGPPQGDPVPAGRLPGRHRRRDLVFRRPDERLRHGPDPSPSAAA